MERSREIQNLTKFNTEDFNFTETFHDLVGNRGFGEGYNRPNEQDKYYIWNVISAIGEGIADVTYSNVLHYTDLVANVDTCKSKQLQSFLDLFGMKMQIFDNNNQLPVEIQNLIDTLSINKKYLFKSSLITDELRDRIEKYGSNNDISLDNNTSPVISKYEQDNTWYYKNIPNSFKIERTKEEFSSSEKTNGNSIYGEYTQTYDIGYGLDDVNDTKLSNFIILRRYQNDYGTSILKVADPLCANNDHTYYILSTDSLFVGSIDDGDEFEGKININNSTNTFNITNNDLLSSVETDSEFIKLNATKQLSISYITSKEINVDNTIYSNDQYYNFVRDIFFETLSHFISLPYNTKLIDNGEILSNKAIYSYQNFWDEYHSSDKKYEELVDDDENFAAEKKAYNISYNFDEKGIVDDIENGTDSLDNYSTNEQIILSAEIERRKSPLNFSELKYNITKITGVNGKTTSYEPYTRYSYYRYKKVKEYIDFVEQYIYSSKNQLSSKEYSYDPNYIIKTNSETINILKNDDEVTVDDDIILKTSEQLANIVQYICKLRETLKIQIRKNYMKGTSNLLRFVVNEYVQEFGKNCGYFTDDYIKSNPNVASDLTTIYQKLINHQVNDVEVIEYVDTTEYYNIETENTSKSATKSLYNSDYFTEYFKYDKDLQKVIQIKQPYELDIGEIRDFYISSLALQEVLDNEDELNDFLSTIYNVGKSKRYLDADLSILVCDLVDGRNSKDMFIKQSIASKCYSTINSYIEGSEYEFKEELISDQISSIEEEVIFTGLSDTYLSNYTEIYDKYIDQISDQYKLLDSLNNEYNTMLSQDLNYYFAKSTIKYCYSDNDVNNGTYKHDYLYDNESYDTPYIFQKISNLKTYSNESNIQNHPLNDMMEYFDVNFINIYDDYTGTIQPYLNSLGFTPTNSSSFSKLLTEAYTFASNKKDSLNNDVEKQWSDFKTQVKDLQTSITEQKTALNVLIGKYTESDEFLQGYVYCLTDTRIPKKLSDVEWNTYEINSDDPINYCCVNRKQPNNPKNYDDICQSYEINGTTYWFYRKSGWTNNPQEDAYNDYPYWKNEVSDGSTWDDVKEESIDSKIEYIRAFLELPKYCKLDYDKETKIATVTENSIKKNGDTTEVTNIQTELNKIEARYDTIYEQMETAGCDDLPSDSTNIEDQIDDLITYLNENNSSKIKSASSDIQSLTRYLNTLSQYKTDVTTMNSDYKSVKSDSSISKYLNDLKLDNEISITAINDIRSYTDKKDSENLNSIQLSVDQYLNEYQTLLSGVQELIYAIRSDIKTLNYSDDFIEIQLSNALIVLENDRDSKYLEGMEIIRKEKSRVRTEFEEIENVLSDYQESTESLSSILQNLISDNDLDSNEEYQKVLNEFNTYTNTENGYQRYYNLKNVTHATRQIHPFMWNFIKYVADSRNTDKIFYSFKVSELENSKVEQYIDKILGKYGNLRDIWKYSIQDFSGYTTRYIANDNVTDNNTEIFEVAEYDGAFYPPAIEQYRKDYIKCINSLSSETTIDTICNSLNKKSVFPSQLSDLLISCELSTMSDYLYEHTLSSFENYLVDDNLYEVVHKFQDEIDVITLSNEITGEETVTTSTKRQDFIDYLKNNVNKTFYERFYDNLELTEDNIKFIVKQLSNKNIRERIYEITDTQTKANLYDIYDYALDKSNNIFVLYKNYGVANPTYKQKQNTLGQIWVRLKNHPIAFPLVSESDSKTEKELSQIKFNDETNIYFKEYIYNEKITRNYCYHFEFTYNKNILAMVCKKTKQEMGDIGEVDNIFQNKYEYASIVMSEVDSEKDDKQNFDRLILTNNNGEFDDIITGANKKGFIIPSEKDISTNVYSFIGMYSPSGSKVKLVYVQKTLEYVNEDQAKIYIHSSKPQILIQEFDDQKQGLDDSNSTLTSTWSSDNTSNNEDINIRDVIFSYNKSENRLTFCFIKDFVDSARRNDVLEAPIDLYANTEGAILKDKFTKPMNSFDVFLQNVCTLVASPKLNEISYTENNINADMSYIPVYPDRERETIIPEDNKEYKCYNIELLGRERNIDTYIDNTNPNPNPNFDIDEINENKKFGRVYEDYLEEYDKTFITTENDSINSNIKGYCKHESSEDSQVIGYSWSFTLGDINHNTYSDADVEDFKIIIFNKDTLGKNPYYFGDLTALVDGRAADYTYYMSDQTSNERKYTGDGLLEGEEYVVIGQNPVDGRTSGIDNNTIYNIANISFKFDREAQILTTEFTKDDVDIDSSINKGQIKYVLYNTKDITVFEYYHLFDQYGLINVRYGVTERLFNNGREYGGYKFVYDTSKYSKEYLKNQVAAWYQMRSKNYSIDDLHLSDYNCLSDVYIFQDYNRLQFKYSDQDIFHISAQNYYFPTLNTKYPYTTGQLIAQQASSIGDTSDNEGNSVYEIFDNYDVYIIDFQENFEGNNKIDIGTVDIPRMYNPNDFVLAFEDYLDVDYNLRPDYYNAKSLQYLIFSSLSTSEMDLTGDIDLSDLNITMTSRTSEEILEDLSKLNDTKDEMFILSSEAGLKTKSTRYDRINLSETNIDIKGLTNLYVNYKRDEDLNGITLYFNYNNYLNSPFIKFDDDYNILIDTIDSTYLKLKSGENGYLDIIIQVKHIEDNVLIGYKNLTLLRYQIFNISDDKPKFIVRKLSTIQKDEYKQNDSLVKTCDFGVNDIILNQSQLFNYEKSRLQTDIVIQLYSDNAKIKGVDFYLFFPSEVFEFDTLRSPSKCDVTYTGMGSVHVTSDESPSKITIPIITVSEAFDLLNADTNIYELFVDSVQVFDEDGNSLGVNIENGIFKVEDSANSINRVLTKENEQEVSEAGIQDSNNTIKTLITDETGKKTILSEVK